MALSAAVEAQGFPAGMFSMVQGSGIDVGQWLVANDGIEAVGFTGSLRGGRAVYDAAAARPRPIPVYAEMGSINPVVITQAALASRGDEIAEGLVGSVTLGTGQFCTNPGLILLENSAASQDFITAVTEKMEAAPEGVLLNAAIASGLQSAVSQTRGNPNISILTGGEAVDESDFFCFRNTVMQTSAAAIRDDDRLQVEHFGPVTLFVVCEDNDDLRATVDALEGNLTSTVHAEADELDSIGDPAASTAREGGAGDLEWFPYRCGGGACHAARRTLSGDHGAGHDLCGHERDLSIYETDCVSECAGRAMLPDALKEGNPLGIMRLVDDVYTEMGLSSWASAE